LNRDIPCLARRDWTANLPWTGKLAARGGSSGLSEELRAAAQQNAAANNPSSMTVGVRLERIKESFWFVPSAVPSVR